MSKLLKAAPAGQKVQENGINFGDFPATEWENKGVSNKTEGEARVILQGLNEETEVFEKQVPLVGAIVASFKKGKFTESPFVTDPIVKEGFVTNEVVLKDRFTMACVNGEFMN